MWIDLVSLVDHNNFLSNTFYFSKLSRRKTRLERSKQHVLMLPSRFPEWSRIGEMREENAHYESIQMYSHEWTKCDRDSNILSGGVRVRRDFNSTRNGNREAEIIPSSREGFPRVICVRSFFELYARIGVLACVPIVHSALGSRHSALRRQSTVGGSFIGVRFNSEALAFILCFPSAARGTPATCWSFVINCLHDIPIVEQFVALLPSRKLCFLEPLQFICHSIATVYLNCYELIVDCFSDWLIQIVPWN